MTQPDCAKYANTNWIFNKKSVVISGLGVMVYGAYMGTLFQAHYFSSLSWPFMLNTGLKQIILRWLVVAFLTFPILGTTLAVPADANLAISILFKSLVQLVLGLFLAFGFANYFFVRFNLVDLTNKG